MKKRRLRSGFTTGACAAAAAKAACLHLLSGSPVEQVTILFPDGLRRSFAVCRSCTKGSAPEQIAEAAVIKDAGDDPDVTNRAEIVVQVKFDQSLPKSEINCNLITFIAGPGVGTVTKPGLAVAVGELTAPWDVKVSRGTPNHCILTSF